MTIYFIITIVALITEVLILRFADSKKARRIVFDAFLAAYAVVWSVYVIIQFHFTVKMLVPVAVMSIAVLSIINFIRDLKD